MGQFDFEAYKQKAKKVWGDKYEYSTYRRSPTTGKIEVGIICHEKDKYGREHGLFWKQTSKHICAKQGCPKCEGRFRMNTDYLIETSKLCHTSEFDNLSYEKTVFHKYDEPVIVTCHNLNEDGTEHGDFPITPGHLLGGQGCPICRYLKSAKSKRRTLQAVIDIANQVHGSKYDYSLIKEYKNDKISYPIICPKHGVFKQTFNNHIHWEQGCPKCARERTVAAHKMSMDTFLDKANKRHNGKYTYDKVDLEHRNEEGKICITCPKHGDFWQTPQNHLFGQGCPICRQSRMEAEIAVLLTENHINYIQQHTFDWLKRRRNLHLDFYLPDYQIAIECQGIQHFENEHFGGHDNNDVLTDIQALDCLKKHLCEEHGIQIIYYADYDYDFPYAVVQNKNELIETIMKGGSLRLVS